MRNLGSSPFLSLFLSWYPNQLLLDWNKTASWMGSLYSQKCSISHRTFSFTTGCKTRQYFPSVLDHEHNLKLLDSALCCLLHLSQVCFLGQMSQRTFTEFLYSDDPRQTCVKKRHQVASTSQDREMELGWCTYTFVNTWLLYPQDLQHHIYFSCHYRFLYRITTVH